MAKDVDAALNKIVQEQGGMDPEKASDYVEKMKAGQTLQARRLLSFAGSALEPAVTRGASYGFTAVYSLNRSTQAVRWTSMKPSVA
jgi:hypothetical protein